MISQHRQLGGISNLKFRIWIFQCALVSTFTPDTLTNLNFGGTINYDLQILPYFLFSAIPVNLFQGHVNPWSGVGFT